MTKKRILFASSEIAPFAKNGDLADVSGTFPKMLEEQYSFYLVMPLYSLINVDKFNIEKTDFEFDIPISERKEKAEVWIGKLPETSITVFFIANHYFERDAIYGTSTGDYPDNSERFVFFSRAVLELAKVVVHPDIIHCNDWQTALIPLYLKEVYQPLGDLKNASTVITIHNIEFQGRFWVYDLHILNLGWEVYSPEKLEFYNDLNYLKGGIVYSDVITSPSKKYGEKMFSTKYGHGLNGVLKQYSDKYHEMGDDIVKEFSKVYENLYK